MSCSRRGFIQTTTAGTVLATAATGLATSQSSEDEGEDLDEYRWSSYRNQGFTGSAPISGISEYDREDLSIGSGETATSPSIFDGTIYVGVDNQLIATEIKTGQAKWTYEGEGQFVGGTAVTNETIVGVTAEEEVVAIDTETGSQRWSVGISGAPGFPSASDGTVYVGDHEGHIYAFQSQSGELEWRTEFETYFLSGSDIIQRPAVTIGRDQLYINISYAQMPPSRVEALSFGGEHEWTYEIDKDSIRPIGFSDQGLCVVAESRVSLISQTGGVEQWSTNTSGSNNSGAAVGEDYVAVIDTNAECVLFDIRTGEEVWSYTVGDRNTGYGVTISEDHVYVTVVTGARDGIVTALDIDNGLEQFNFEVTHPYPGLEYGPIPIPNGLFIPQQGKTTLLVNDQFDKMVEEVTDDSPDDGQTDTDEETQAGEDTSTESETSTEGGETQRGIFTNNGGDLGFVDMFTLTVGGFALSVIAIIYQLKDGE